MHSNFTRILLLFLTFSLSLTAQAQLPTNEEQIAKKLASYSQKNPSEKLFLHLDKTLYTNNETIWFSGYLLNNKDTLITSHQFLTASLFREKETKASYTDRFVMENGIAFGNLTLPDTIAEGNYKLIAYTNLLDKDNNPIALFKQAITIKSTRENDLKTIAQPAISPSPLKAKIAVNFYPEGGYLVNGLVNLIGWEAKNSLGNAVNTNAVLYRNNEPIDTISTQGYGLGRFKIIPDQNSIYSLKLLEGKNISDSVYLLPTPVSAGVVLSLKKAVVDDVLPTSIYSNRQQKIQVLIHNYADVFTLFSLTTKIGVLNFNIDLKAMPKGLAVITLLDSLQRPIAERLFFPHFSAQNVASIETDSNSNKQKGLVNVKLSFKNNNADGSVSVAVVQSNRLEAHKQQHIDSYAFLGSELQNLSALEANLSYQDPNYLDNILLVKGWRRYNWLEKTDTISQSSPAQTSMIKFSGSLLHFGKPVRQAKSIILIKDDTFKLINTNERGDFNIEIPDMLANQGRKLWMMVNDKVKTGYTITFKETRLPIGDFLATSAIESTTPYSNYGNTSPFKTNITTLNEVQIKGKPDNSLYKAPIPHVKANLCGDYICSMGHLNCQIISHLGNTKIPKLGDMYMPDFNRTYTTVRSSRNSTATTVDKVPYAGCYLDGKAKNELFQLNGINFSKEFYREPYDSSNINMLDYQSTAYWNHSLAINENGTASFSFNNSDITGDFRIVVQGIGQDGLIFAEKTFTVKKQP